MATPFEQLVDVMRRLRGEGGCPWDRQQTRESLTPFLLEEAHEVLEAIEEGEPARLKEELGDLLFAVVNLSRSFRIDPEEALQRTTRRFCERFRRMELLAQEQGRPLTAEGWSLDELDRLWEEAKRESKAG